MPENHVGAVFKKYPWLARYFNADNFFNARESFYDKKTLLASNHRSHSPNLYVEGYNVTKYFLFSGAGGRIERRRNIIMRFLSLFRPVMTIRERLERNVNIIDECMYIVEVVNGRRMVVYKKPLRDISIRAHLKLIDPIAPRF